MCDLQSMGVGDWDEGGSEMEVVVSDAGVETIDDTFKPYLVGGHYL